jgi:hypothetical protein
MDSDTKVSLVIIGGLLSIILAGVVGVVIYSTTASTACIEAGKQWVDESCIDKGHK